MKIQTAFVLLAALTAASATGCGSSDASKEITGTTRASLHRAKSCGGLLVDLKADATFKLNQGINRQIQAIQKCVARNGDANCAYAGGGVSFGSDSRESSLDGAAGAAPPQASPTNAGASGFNEKATSHSETNSQVAGVDEADFVKTDGKHLFVLHGRAFKVLQAWPVNDLKELSTLDIEGTPTEMFVDGDKVVVYSQVNGASLYTAAGVTPKEQFQDWTYASGGRGMPGGMPVADGPAIAPAPDGSPTTTTPPQLYIPLTKITVLTLAGATPTISREMYFEGSYLDSRRVGTHVRTVLSGHAHGPLLKYGVYDLYPQPTNATTIDDGPTAKGGGGIAPTEPTNSYPKTGTEMIAALEQLRSVNKGIIDASLLDQWLPYTFVKEASVVRASSVACEDFYIPTVGSTQSGLTEIASIDLANPAAPPRESAILGHAQTVYGSADTLYLAASAWVEPPFMWNDGDTPVSSGSGGGTGSAPPPTTAEPAPPKPGARSLKPQTSPTNPAVIAWSQTKTHLHKFEFATDATFPNYVASGTVLGNVKDQFSLDDRGGYLRVATSESRMYTDPDGRYVSSTTSATPGQPQDRPGTVNHVFVMGVDGQWLDVVGDVGELAPNEQIYSVRFVDGRGYVVTFRRVDPLFVLDLTNPTAPTKIAELKIPGFSEYMHPLGPNHILTIGRDATETGRAEGLQLQIFDVSNGANPVLAHKFTYTNTEYGQSEAEHDHKAFTYFADQKMLAFPYYAYSNTGSGGMHSSLELFRVDAGAGFAKLGSIDHSPLVAPNPTGYCGGYYSPQVRRGVFLDNFVFSISYGGVIAKDANDLAGVGVKLPLAAPQTNPGYGPSCGGDVGF